MKGDGGLFVTLLSINMDSGEHTSSPSSPENKQHKRCNKDEGKCLQLKEEGPVEWGAPMGAPRGPTYPI